ncbi:MAG: GTPase Era, partial [Solirubrobacteraceae bacterium]
ERMQRRVERELADADGCLLVLDATGSRPPHQAIGPGDRFIARLLARAGAGADGVPVTIAVNKIDRAGRAGRGQVAAALEGAEALGLGGDIFPVSARTGAGVAALIDHLAGMLPPGPLYFPAGQRSDQAREVVLAELVREQVLARTRQEVPHAVEVEVEEIAPLPSGVIRIQATLLVETESQKGILIGASGSMIRSIGTAARRAIERELGERVHLELSVRVRRHWRADERVLDRLGIE